MQVRSVTQVTQYIKVLLDNDDELADLWVEGEVSNFSRASSGHCYFTLKDSECELRCVMWRTQASLLNWMPRPGDWVEAHGHVSVYERGGAYQFYADVLERGGIGARWREFEALKQRLQAEGLFEEVRKRPLPTWPRRIGVVTSPSGAAWQDILSVLGARYPLAEVVFSPSLVQGDGAPESLVQALARLNQQDDIDVVIIARGGGSLEDLWAFNDERVARAVVASRAPVVSGVGHEVDFTITDFVADLRAPTPSAAAAAVVPDIHVLRTQLRDGLQALGAHISRRINGLRESWERERRLLRLHDPQKILAEQRQRVDDLMRRASSAWEHNSMLRRIRVNGYIPRLQALDPRSVLARGYAMVQDGLSGVMITSTQQTALGQELSIHLHDGSLGARVTEISSPGSL